MRKSLALATLLGLLSTPQTLLGQGAAIGVRAGTLGLGGELALGLTDYVVLRGGYGWFPLEFEGTYDDVDYTVSPPNSIGTVGIDLYPGGGSFRLMGGIMFRKGDVTMETGELADLGEIGDTEYDVPGTLLGTLVTKTTAPFAGIGFGRHTRAGFGLSMEFGVAFVGEPEVELEASGPITSVPGFQEELQKEAGYLEEDLGGILKFWPIVSIGMKIPLG
ncbi:hypothetical protein ACFL3S_01155 [Gemmatimonadota bacterium]